MATKPRVSVSEIEVSGGQTFTFSPEEKVLLVGPNNSGKSEFLREIRKTLGWHDGEINFDDNKVIKKLSLHKEGSSDSLKEYLDRAAELRQQQFRYKNYQIHMNSLSYFSGRFLGQTSAIFCKNLGAEGRLGITAIQKGVGIDGQKTAPQHLMYDDQSLLKRVSDLFKKAFQRELFIDYRATPQIPIHVGNPPDQNEFPNQVSDEYVQEVRKNPRLDQQGDGMRSYAGILFELVAIEHDITLLDEPEAFLHPPQMRRLGETLSEEATNQIFVATHSSDILRGFLNGSNGAVKIIRLERSGDTNNATMTSPARINELWDQPELRYSNALDGIFHEQVVICEDDSDCRLYNSIADHLERNGPEVSWPDTAYVPSGGKAAIPKISRALREIGVPVKVIADLDLLNDGVLLRVMVEALGGQWDSFEHHWRRLDAAVRDGVPSLSPEEIKAEISSVIENSAPDALPKSDIQSLLKQTSPWAMVKKLGMSAIPRGDSRTVFQELDENLKSLGIFLVPVGEAENFCPEVGLHGPKFVSKLFETIPLSSDNLQALRDFVTDLFEH